LRCLCRPLLLLPLRLLVVVLPPLLLLVLLLRLLPAWHCHGLHACVTCVRALAMAAAAAA
jgi:hypothetical protein